MHLTDLQAKARMRNDFNSTKTIAMTMAAFFLCYLPVFLYALVAQLDGSKANIWFSYASWLVHCFSTIVNPCIYYTRANKFRHCLETIFKRSLWNRRLSTKCLSKESKTRSAT